MPSYPSEPGQPNISVGSESYFVKAADGNHYRLLVLSLTINTKRTQFGPIAVQLDGTPASVSSPVATVADSKVNWRGRTFPILSK
jgi:hypothetical protein